MQKNLDRALSVHGIGVSEFMILHTLFISEEQFMSRINLASSISLTASAITKLIAPMEKLNLVDKEKNERDARMSLVVMLSLLQFYNLTIKNEHKVYAK